jgi:hypothetical protein
MELTAKRGLFELDANLIMMSVLKTGKKIKMKRQFVPALILLLVIVVGCEPQQQGDRILGMDIKEVPSVPYSTAYNEATSMGVHEVSVSLDWARLEPTVANYDNSLPGESSIVSTHSKRQILL